MTQLLPPKKEVALALLERSNVDVYLDPRAKGVVVPPQFRKEPRLILKIGLNMPVPIPDLRLDDESLSCTLSFNRTPFYCIVPWPSVFAMVGDDGRGMVWPDDVPQELAVRVVEDSKDESAPALTDRAERTSRKGKRAVEESRPSLREASEASDRPSDRAKGDLDRPSRPKRGAQKKKKEEQRPAQRPTPVLVAVPARDREREREPEKITRKNDDRVREVKEERAKPNGRPQPAPQPRTSPDRGPSSSRPKRELPPYLRVVK